LERRFLKQKNGQKITKTEGSDKKRFGPNFFLLFNMFCYQTQNRKFQVQSRQA